MFKKLLEQRKEDEFLSNYSWGSPPDFHNHVAEEEDLRQHARSWGSYRELGEQTTEAYAEWYASFYIGKTWGALPSSSEAFDCYERCVAVEALRDLHPSRRPELNLSLVREL